ncbi:hypothetical protein J1N35_004562 [Gossypium stocksii]|uniref:Aminotransferase-like plant mobile domain-containing protein n=1 Tax=Gossypium stocksii TaxID=47602 RepID=A0A9D3WD09_9ROSI|nr:hypothetical protein J1N35_004562 [Gossypium stocksii]
MLDRSRNLVHLMWLFKLVNFREADELNWGFAMLATLYWRCVERCNHRKLKLVVAFYYCNHKRGGTMGRVTWDYRISYEIYDFYYTNDRKRRYDFLPTREAIFVLELACILEYMSWFRIHGKTYLYGKRRGIGNRIRGGHGGTLYIQRLARQVYHQHPCFVFGAPSLMYYMPMPSIFPTITYRPFMFQALIESPLVMSSVYETQHSYTHLPFVIQTPPISLFYQGGSSSQPPIPRPEDAQ